MDCKRIEPEREENEFDCEEDFFFESSPEVKGQTYQFMSFKDLSARCNGDVDHLTVAL